MRAIVFGCGYVGHELGRQLVAAGHEVFGVRRQADAANELRPQGIQPLVADVANPESLATLPGRFDWVANTVSSSQGDAAVYRQVYWEGNRNVQAWLKARGCVRYVYTSSTSVYAQQDGSMVTEQSPTEPRSETAQVLLATEQLWTAAEVIPELSVGIFRVAGIYGPSRGHLYQQFLRGEARLVGDGNRLINMIHRDDVASALRAFLTAPNVPAEPRIYNAVDDLAVTHGEFLEWLSLRLGRSLPPRAEAGEGRPSKRGPTQKRVSNQRLRGELGWQPQFPTYREGYEQLIQDAQQASARIG